MKKNILILLYENDIFHCLKVAKELSKNYKINFFLVDTISAFSNVNYTKDIILKSEIEHEVYEDLRDEIKDFNIVADKNLEIATFRIFFIILVDPEAVHKLLKKSSS